MLEKIIEILKESKADAWEITDTKTRGWEFYFIRHDLDQNRAKDVEHIRLTVHRSLDNGEALGSASDEIRQIHRFFDIFRQILQILLRNQARSKRSSALSLCNSKIKECVVEHVDQRI